MSEALRASDLEVVRREALAQKVKDELGVNLVLGASNISFGMPERDLINNTFVSEEGRIAENRLVELADRAGMALIGPNTMGILTTAYAGIFAGPVFKGEMAPGTTDFISHNWILS